jgi:hypothetical protein
MFTSKREKTSGEEGDKREGRRSTASSSSYPLTEQTLLQLEQSLPNYRLAQRNLNQWFFYIESTVQDTFDTYRNLPDLDFYPSAFDGPYSTVSLSQADFQESHHSPAGSSDLFGFTVRSPREIQVVIPSRAHSPTHSRAHSPSRVSPVPPPQSTGIQPRSRLLSAPQEAPFEFYHFDSEPPPQRASPSRSPSPPSHPLQLTRLRPRKRHKPFDPSSVEIIEIPDS